MLSNLWNLSNYSSKHFSNQVIPYRQNVHLKAEENYEVSCGTCPTIAHSASPTTFQSPSMSPLVSTSPPCFIPPSIPLTTSLTACIDRLDQFLVPGSSGNDINISTCNWIIRNNFCYQTIPWRSNANLDSAAHCSVTCGLCPFLDNQDQFFDCN